MSDYLEVISLSDWKRRHAGSSGKSRRSDRRDGRQDNRSDRQDGRQANRADRQDGRQDRRADRDAAQDARQGNRQAERTDRQEDRWERKATYGGDFAGETALGPNLNLRARSGFRAAISEIKPGLFLVAEVPEKSMEFGFGPLLGTALVKQLGRVFQRNQAGQGAVVAQRPDFPALPGPAPAQPVIVQPAPPQVRRRPFARWLDADLAGELGCTCEDT